MVRAEIEFRSPVNGKEYTVPSCADYGTSSYTLMKRKAHTYAPGTHHAIRHDPTDHNDIRFDVGKNFGFFLLT